MLTRKLAVLILIGLIFSPTISGAKSYKGAEYRTIENFLYGRFEVRYKPAHREGVVSSFFTYHEIESSAEWNEIDIEFVGRYEKLVQFNSITPGQKYHIRSQQLEFNPYSDFHNYAFEWTPDYVAWFIDGVEVYRQTGEHISTLEYPQKIMMNIWNPVYTNWVGYFDDAYLPTVSIYDFVKYSSYTPGNGNIGTNKDFTLQWQDDFNSFDTERWEMASHTFGGNQADFDPENVVFKDGFLHLYLTNEEEKSGLDNKPPKILWAMANYDSTITAKLSEEITNESAENLSNFLLPGSEISDAKLDSNIYLILRTDNYNPYSLNNLIYSNLIDLSNNSNTAPTAVVQVSPLDTAMFPIKVNVGGEEYLDYYADQEWSHDVQYGYLMGDAYNYSLNTDINNTDEDEIFRSDRRGIISYKFKVPDGSYLVKLFFSDNNNNSTGESIFNVLVENNYAVKNMDVFSLAGKNTSYIIETETEVQDGVMDIYFEEEIDSAFISAISVDQIITSIDVDHKLLLNKKFELDQNYPNPFNPTTLINYTLIEDSHVKIDIYDLLGNKIKTLVNGNLSEGRHKAEFNAVNQPSGIYFYTLSVNRNSSITKKMILLK